MKQQLQLRYQQIVHWIKSHRVQSIAIAGALVVVFFGALTYWFYESNKPVVVQPDKIDAKPRPKDFYSPLTGVKVKDEAATKQLVTAIMIENSPDARPHSGLKEAGVVYEAVAEARITRYLALYQESKPGLIGPVRSLRPYFIDWAAPFDAAIVHVGGSAKALREVRNGQYRDIDQFFNADTFWRASDRYAPHNVYTNFKRLDALTKSKKYTRSEFTAWERADGKAAATPDATRVQISYGSPSYNTEYRYNKEKNTYTRYLAGAPHKDREKGNITPSVVIAMMVDEQTVMEDGARESIKTSGRGKAYIFQNGTVREAVWRKADKKSQIQWLTSDGKPIELARGQTWIAAVPNSYGNVSW